MKILFVCTGNTCRSPMAEAVCKMLYPDIESSSRGVSVFMPLPISKNAYTALLEEYNIDFKDHTSKQITKEDFEYFDVILTMTVTHKDHLKQVFNEYKDKIFTLTGYTQGFEIDISDPYGGSLDIYKQTLKQIYTCLISLKEVIK